MTDIETLTAEDRLLLEQGVAGTPQGEKALRIIDVQAERIRELWARIALACEVADHCSGDYMRAILTGEIDRAEHESRTL